jgi:hypothetical protein
MIPVVGFKDYFVDGEKIISMKFGKYKVLKCIPNAGGYLLVTLCDGIGKPKFKYVHRLIAQAYLSDYSEDLIVDHIDRNKANNDISNLRMVTCAQNLHNTDAKGYSFHKASGKWIAYIGVKNKLKYIGYFNTEAEARQAYLDAKKIDHPTAPINATAV